MLELRAQLFSGQYEEDRLLTEHDFCTKSGLELMMP